MMRKVNGIYIHECEDCGCDIPFIRENRELFLFAISPYTPLFCRKCKADDLERIKKEVDQHIAEVQKLKARGLW